jgi:hypothetical protein
VCACAAFIVYTPSMHALSAPPAAAGSKELAVAEVG